jgi:hypothetical protein
MSTADEPPATPQQPVPPESQAAPPPVEPTALQQRLQQLEAAHARALNTIAALEAERNAYRQAAYQWALAQITESDIERYAQDEDGLPLEAFVENLATPSPRKDA